MLEGWITNGNTLLLPQNGAITLAGAGSWTGYGVYVRTNWDIKMLISGHYNGGFVSDFGAEVEPLWTAFSGQAQPNNANANGSATTQAPLKIADPVNVADGAFELEATDLSLGGREPRGLSLARYYSSRRRNINLAGMAPGWLHNYYVNVAEISAPLAGLDGTTPAQMAPMLVATCAASGLYNHA